jgi:hypothetical protein
MASVSRACPYGSRMPMTLSRRARWIRFLRQYGPIARYDNMYDENIRKSARRVVVRPLAFVHPFKVEMLALFRPGAEHPQSVSPALTYAQVPLVETEFLERVVI